MVYEEDQIRERILKVLHREGISQIEFSARIGRAQSNVSDIMRGKRSIPNKFLADIIEAFPDINKDWLIFGEGAMNKGENIPGAAVSSETRPRLPKTMAEGNIEAYLNGPKRAECTEKKIVTQFPDYEFTLILKNDRMSPKYQRGDELAFRKTTIVEWGNDYLLDTTEGPKFKKVFKTAEGVRCVSYNKKEYPDFEIARDQIYGYYKCVGVIRVM